MAIQWRRLRTVSLFHGTKQSPDPRKGHQSPVGGTMKHALLTLILLLSVTNIVIAGDFEDGMAAFQSNDYATAFAKFTKAAEAGNASAQFGLGVMYATGRGVSKDYQQAVRWYTKAAEAGGVNAQYNLASMYYRGQGVPQDYVLAHMWANLAAIKNSEYVKKRDALASFMTPTQVAEAQKLAREWKPKE